MRDQILIYGISKEKFEKYVVFFFEIKNIRGNKINSSRYIYLLVNLFKINFFNDEIPPRDSRINLKVTMCVFKNENV